MSEHPHWAGLFLAVNTKTWRVIGHAVMSERDPSSMQPVRWVLLRERRAGSFSAARAELLEEAKRIHSWLDSSGEPPPKADAIAEAAGCPDGADLVEWVTLCRRATRWLFFRPCEEPLRSIRNDHTRLTRAAAPPRPVPTEPGWYGGSWDGGDAEPREAYLDRAGRLLVLGVPVADPRWTWLPSDDPSTARDVTL